MKRLLLLALAFGLLRVGVQAGVILVQKVESEGQTGEITLTLDGAMARVDLSPAVSILIDGDSGEQVALMHLMKQYLTMSLKEGKRLAHELEKVGKAKKKDGPKLVATGKKARIGKYLTEIYSLEAGNLRATYWIAVDFPDEEIVLKALGVMQLGATASATESVLPGPDDLPGLPVKTEVVLETRKVTNTLVSVVFGPVDARLFEIPEGYIATEKLPPEPVSTLNAPAPREP